MNNAKKQHTVLIDFRNADMANKDCLTKISQKYRNVSYLNLPLNDDDFLDNLYSKTSHLPEKIRLITMCAKGYRSTIGYSMLNLVKKPEWNIQLCRNSFA